MRKPYINKIHIILEVIGYLACILALVYAIVMANTIEGEIPTHYNIEGEIDGYGSASSLIILPAIMLGTMLLMSACLHLLSANAWNTGFKLNPEKQNIVLADLGYMIASMVLEIGLFTAVATFLFTSKGGIILLASGVLIVATSLSCIVFFIKAYRDNRN